MYREFKQGGGGGGDADSVVLASDNDTADSIKFGVDSNGRYGFIAPGADTVTPFRGFGDLEFAYNQGIADARAEWITSTIINGSNSNGSYIYSGTVTFNKDYAQVVAFFSCDDSDDNGDNFMKVYSSDKEYTTAANPSSSYWTNTVDEWNYYKPTVSGYTAGGGLSKTATDHYSSTPNDQNKDVYRAFSNRYVHSCVAYKNNIEAGDMAWIYASHGALVHFVGIPAAGTEPYSGATPTSEEADMYQRGYAAGYSEGTAHASSDAEPVLLGNTKTWFDSGRAKHYSVTFGRDYSKIMVFFNTMDNDNNGDNFMKAYSVNKNISESSDPTAYWTDTVNEYSYIKYDGTGVALAKTNTQRYSSVPNDLNKDAYLNHPADNSSTGHSFTCIAYKNNVKQGEAVHCYASHGCNIFVIGII